MMSGRPFLAGFFGALALAALVASSALVLAAGEITAAYGWTANIVRERTIILDRPQPDRIVIVAGSGGLFGISAAELSRRTGRPVVNASSHAALQWEMLDYYFLSRVVRGDTVIFPLEYQYYLDGSNDTLTNLSAEAVHSLGLGYFWTLPMSEKWRYVSLLRPRFLKMQIASAVGEYRFVAAGGYWKYPSHWNGDLDTRLAQSVAVAPLWGGSGVGPKAYQRLCASFRRLAARGVRVIGTPPNAYVREGSRATTAKLLAEAANLFKDCHGEFVVPESSALFGPSDMIDTPYHLTPTAKMKRTSDLADALCARAIRCK